MFIPSILQKSELLGFVDTFAADLSADFPISGMLGDPITYVDNDFVIDLIERLRSANTDWRSAPAPATPIALDVASKILAQALFLNNKVEVTTADIAYLSDAHEFGASRVLKSAAAAKEEAIVRSISMMLEYHARSFEQLCINFFTAASVTVSKDGASTPISLFDLNVQKTTTNFATASTDIPAEFGDHIAAAELWFGGPVKRILCGGEFSQTLAKNEKIREFAIRNSEWRSLLRVGLDAPMSEPNYDIVVSNSSTGSSAGFTRQWPSLFVVMLGPKWERSLRWATQQNLDNDFMGGHYARTVEKHDPEGIDVVASFNGLPIIADKSQIYVMNANGP